MKKILLNLFLVCAFYSHVQSQDTPFNCDYNAYLFQFNDVYAIDLASGNSYTVATDVTPGNINAAAYNPADGFIWGSLSTPEKTIVRIGKDFTTQTFYIDELPTSNRYVGGISATGIYYLKGGGSTYYSVDVDPNSQNYGQFIANLTLSQSLSVHDWAFNAVDNQLYTVEKNSNILYRINAETGVVTSLGEVPILSGLNYTYGAVYFDISGRFYVSANQTGTVYVIQNVQDLDGVVAMDSNLFAFGPSSSSNDGARCPTAPVSQEDCTNGIDDDGDGLIDCEDPSCSGYADCPVIEVSTASSANDGGLESNNRLSELVNKRNFNRVKKSYKFNKTTAKRFTKTSKYGKSVSGKGKVAGLQDFIPLSVINEDQVIESSPEDLVTITNAKALYSVDYLKQGEAVGSILVLETDNGVYEHTKYICDRLLGAQLVSVSTIEIREQQFIKALIRNSEGGLEFVLSLSAKPVANGSKFEIESHWNLDEYEAGASYYNFQIWSNSLDDLVRLGEEVVRLLEVQKPIESYNNSTPPTVFVRQGKYHNGKLDLEIVNTNASDTIVFNAGVRATETQAIETVSTTIDLDGNYISNVEVDAGSLFDIGFRISSGTQTPDDLFLSDGPWGYDDSKAEIKRFDVEANTAAYNADEFPVERNVNLVATTNDYVATYRALTPRFNPIDVSAYNSLKLNAKGSGVLNIRLIKASVNAWEAQYGVNINLTENLTAHTLLFSEFTASSGAPIVANDITSIVYTMTAENGEQSTKTMRLEQVRFATSTASTTGNVNPGSTTLAQPNPMTRVTNIQFTSIVDETVTLKVYNQLGRLVKEIAVDATIGANAITLKRSGMASGVYFCKLSADLTEYKTLKLVLK